MSNMDDLKTSFEKKLDAQYAAHSARLEQDLAELRASLLRAYNPVPLPEAPRRAAQMAATWAAPAASPLNGLVELSGSSKLKEVDDAFLQLFILGAYYPTNRLAYPTVYCETLAEFFSPQLEQLNLSSQARQAVLKDMIADAEQTAREHGGILGYNLPGKGAYLNGWLFAYNTQVPASQVFAHPALARRVYETAIHEKLGHGFLFGYSALGQVKIRLGLGQAEIARRFDLRTVDDPLASLRNAQAGLVFQVSQLLEEGWATWLEMYLGAALAGEKHQPRYSLPQVLAVIQALPAELPGRETIQQSLLTALLLLFGEDETPMAALRDAVIFFDFQSAQLDEFFGQHLGQPLRYVIGELLFSQAQANLGAQCLPYAALIAANLSFDPAGLGLNDLADLLTKDPRLNPDVRLAALSRMKLREKNNIQHLARQAAAELSISIPSEFK